jgi:hypothetical protein
MKGGGFAHCNNHYQAGRGMALYSPAKMKDKEFNLFSSFIYEQVGIQLPPAKKTMLEARLQKRLKLWPLTPSRLTAPSFSVRKEGRLSWSI